MPKAREAASVLRNVSRVQQRRLLPAMDPGAVGGYEDETALLPVPPTLCTYLSTSRR